MLIRAQPLTLLILYCACNSDRIPEEQGANEPRTLMPDDAGRTMASELPIDAAGAVTALDAAMADSDADSSWTALPVLDGASSWDAMEADSSQDATEPGDGAGLDTDGARGPCGICTPGQVCLEREGMFRCAEIKRGCNLADPCSCVVDPRTCAACTYHGGHVSCVCPAC
jgi:hypothetical protein